ncbi:MAG TPA: hypothetical protein VFB44_10355 [Thermoleophilaceae bacterium]|nr:hypothetical protein [Thermoleophilaceae bacterium]
MIGIAPFYYTAKAAEHRPTYPVTVSRRRRRRPSVIRDALGRRRRAPAPVLGS